MLSYILFKLLQIKYSLFYLVFRNTVVLNACFKANRLSLLDENWGDDINIVLPYLISHKIVIPYNVVFKSIRRRFSNNVMCVGSIIQWQTNENSIIWGSGAVSDEIPLLQKPKMVLAVRGPLTRLYLLKQGVDCPEIYGDPALLFPKYYHAYVSKKYKVGIIAHKIDQKNEVVIKLIKQLDAIVIDISHYHKDWKFFIDSINECEFVLSSSLHGLIVSEAYGVPNKWVKFSENIIGGNFKYNDFYQSIGKFDEHPLILNLNNIDKINIKKLKNNWKSTAIDTRKLLDSCPFK